jgi:plasmid stabilization system protein ParE
MAHRVAPEAEAELDNIWDYVAKESGSTEIADHLIDSIAERFRDGGRHDRKAQHTLLRSWPLKAQAISVRIANI